MIFEMAVWFATALPVGGHVGLQTGLLLDCHLEVMLGCGLGVNFGAELGVMLGGRFRCSVLAGGLVQKKHPRRRALEQRWCV